jgi:hypothetical protein
MNSTLSDIRIYEWPAETVRSPHFTVTIEGQPVPVCATGVAAFLVVAFEGTVRFEVTVESPVKSASLRPLSRDVPVQIEGCTVRFQLERPDNFSLEIDGLMPLFIFANSFETAWPDADDSSVHFFGGGKTHEIGELEIGSGETVYIEGGAVVRGAIRAADATDITIRGHGVLDGSLWKHNDNVHRSIQWEKCADVLLEDIVMIHPSTWMVTAARCDRVQIRNLKQIGECVSSDGIDVVGSQNVLIENCFLLNNDDCIAVKSHYGHHPHARYEDWRGDVRHVEVRDCVFLNARAGNVMEIGFELQTDSISDITFRNIDVLSGHGEGGVFTIHNGDNATVSRILWEDIRVEHFYDKLVDFRILNSRWSGPNSARGQIRDVHLKNIRVVQDIYNSPSLIGGYDENHTVEGVVFEDFYIGDKAITSADELHLFHKHAKKIRFTTN